MAWRLAFTISGLLVPISLVYTYYRYKFSYFERRGIPHMATNILRRQCITQHLLRSAYNRFKVRAPIAGIYLGFTPAIIILDLELVKRVLIEDFSNFSDRLRHQTPSRDVLHSLDNAEWQAMRRKLTPCFWSAQMSRIFPNIAKAAERLVAKIGSVLESDGSAPDLQMLCTRYAANALVSCIFGLQPSEAGESAQAFRMRINELLTHECQTRLAANYMTANNDCRVSCTHAQAEAIDLSADFTSFLRAMIKERSPHEAKQNDILQLLVDLFADDADDQSDASKEDYELRAIQLLTQSLATLITGFANSVKILTSCLQELASNAEIQRQLRQDIVSVLQSYQQELSYEAIGHMYYLDQVVAETLRKHPTAEVLLRRTLSDYRVPGTAFTIERGTSVLVPVHAIHHDPAIYPAPEQFDPARFEAAAVIARHACAYLPYDDGPRNCLGKRLSKMLIKVALVALLRVNKFERNGGVDKLIDDRGNEVIQIKKI